MQPLNRIAILIDAENIDPSLAPTIFESSTERGDILVREIYGQGTSLAEWTDPIMEYAIHTNLTLNPNRYKNTSDIALVIGAMSILTRNLKNPSSACDTIIIVSSDSDFAPLAVALRTEGIQVIGMGEEGHPVWSKACSEFVTLSHPAASQITPTSSADEEETGGANTIEETKLPEEPVKTGMFAPTHLERVKIIRSIIDEQIASHDGRIKTGELFKALSPLPDYKVDQRKSKRNPVEYLQSQYSRWYVFTPGERGSYWVEAKTTTPAEHITPEQKQPVVEEPHPTDEV